MGISLLPGQIMYFPQIHEIASKDVLVLDEERTVMEGVRSMSRRNIHSVIIRKKDRTFGLLSASDLIHIQQEFTDLNIPFTRIALKRVPVVKRSLSLPEVLDHIRSDDEYVCVIDGQENLEAIVSYTDIISGIGPALSLSKQQLGDLLFRNILKTIPVSMKTGEALAMLTSVSDAVIIVHQGKPIGILTTRDSIRLLDEGFDLERPVTDCMSSPVDSLVVSSSIQDALDFLGRKKYRRILVTGEQGEIIGLLTQRDLVASTYSKWSELLQLRENDLKDLIHFLEERNRQLEIHSTTDPLTGIGNRRSFDASLREMLHSMEAGDFHLAILDVDFFKNINDSLGHREGDLVLRSLSDLVTGELIKSHPKARLYRWGGEEFTILFPGIAVDECFRICEQIRESFHKKPILENYPVTVSIGLSTCEKGDTERSLLGRADRSLYAAKSSGRDRVVFFEKAFSRTEDSPTGFY